MDDSSPVKRFIPLGKTKTVLDESDKGGVTNPVNSSNQPNPHAVLKGQKSVKVGRTSGRRLCPRCGSTQPDKIKYCTSCGADMNIFYLNYQAAGSKANPIHLSTSTRTGSRTSGSPILIGGSIIAALTVVILGGLFLGGREISKIITSGNSNTQNQGFTVVQSTLPGDAPSSNIAVESNEPSQSIVIPLENSTSDIYPILTVSVGNSEDYLIDFEKLDFVRVPFNFDVYGSTVTEYGSGKILDLEKMGYDEVFENNLHKGWGCFFRKGNAVPTPEECWGKEFLGRDSRNERRAFLLSESIIVDYTDEKIRLYDINLDKVVKEWEVPADYPENHSLHVDGIPGKKFILVWGSNDGFPNLFLNANTLEITGDIGLFVSEVNFTSDGSYMILEGETKKGRVFQEWDINGDNPRMINSWFDEMDMHSTAFSSGGKYKVEQQSEVTRITSISSGEVLVERDGCYPGSDLAFSPDGRYVVGTEDCDKKGPYSVFILDTKTGKTVAELESTDEFRTIPQLHYIYPDKSLVNRLFNLDE